MAPCFVSNYFPFLLSSFTDMPNRDNCDQGILALGGHGWIKPRRSVDIEARVDRQVEIPNNALKIFPVIICKKQRMGRELSIALIHSPEKADDRARKSFALQ